MFLKHTLQLGASGIVLGLLFAAFAVPPRASALSLSLSAGVHLPLLLQLGVTADASLLETPLVQARANAAIRPPATAALPTPPPLASIGVTIPPAATPVRTPSPPVVTPSTATPSATLLSEQSNTLKPAQTKVPAKNVAKASVATAAKHRFLGFDLPNGLRFMPQSFEDKNNSFRVAVALLTGAAVLFLCLATFTTTRLARGSPQKV
jgi:hypothetical protein